MEQSVTIVKTHYKCAECCWNFAKASDDLQTQLSQFSRIWLTNELQSLAKEHFFVRRSFVINIGIKQPIQKQKNPGILKICASAGIPYIIDIIEQYYNILFYKLIFLERLINLRCFQCLILMLVHIRYLLKSSMYSTLLVYLWLLE